MGLRRGVASSSNNTNAAVTSKSEHLRKRRRDAPGAVQERPSHRAILQREGSRLHVAP